MKTLSKMRVPSTLLISGWDSMKKYTILLLGLQIALVIIVSIMQYFNHFSIYSKDMNTVGLQDAILM
jgi:hypothetical protein